MNTKQLIDALNFEHQCPTCDEAIAMLQDIAKRKDDSVHRFQLTITCHNNKAQEIHIRHHNSR